MGREKKDMKGNKTKRGHKDPYSQYTKNQVRNNISPRCRIHMKGICPSIPILTKFLFYRQLQPSRFAEIGMKKRDPCSEGKEREERERRNLMRDVEGEDMMEMEIWRMEDVEDMGIWRDDLRFPSNRIRG